MTDMSKILANIKFISFGLLIFTGLYLLSLYNYLLFHTIAEFFSIVIGCSIFILAWNSSRIVKNDYLLFIGIGFLFISLMDFLHAISYKGMGVFPGYDANVATQLWIAARFLESITLLIAPLIMSRGMRAQRIFLAFGIISSFLIASIFVWEIFPVCFIEGMGLTPFKIISEYIISSILAVAIFTLYKKKKDFDASVLKLLIASIIMTIASEMFFASYINVYGISNLFGHYLKILSFYLIYRAIIQTGLAKPYNFIFKELKESTDKMHKYLDIAGSIIVALNAQQKITLLNKKGCDILKCTQHDALGKNWFDTFIPERDRNNAKQTFEMSLTGNMEPIEYYENSVITQGGEERMIAWYNTLIRDDEGNIIGSLSSGEDITERKHADEKLKQTLDKLACSNSDLEQFAYLASHDLKSPLISISGFVNLLAKEYKDKFDEKALQYIKFVVNNIKSMENLIDNLLTYSRIDSRSNQLKPVDLHKVFTRALMNLTLEIQKKRAKVTYDKLPTLVGNDVQMEQLLQNLIGNAIKFHNQKPPRVHVSAEKKDGNWILSVADNGIGIASEERERIFNMFERHSVRSEYKGTGIGLAICKKIVEHHGGKIWVESEINKGSTFIVSLPS